MVNLLVEDSDCTWWIEAGQEDRRAWFF